MKGVGRWARRVELPSIYLTAAIMPPSTL